MKSPNGNVQNPTELEKQITDALHTLGCATPPEGMSARVLRHARQTPVKRAGIFLAPSWKLAAAACGMVFMCGIATRKHNDIKQRDAAAHIPASQIASLTPNMPARWQQTTPHVVPNVNAQRHLSFAEIHCEPQHIVSTKKPALQEDMAYAEMRAPSKPAPAMPFTQQERLLLAVAHREDATHQIAELKRPIWPLHDPDQDDDFEQFFQRPPALPQHGDSQ